MESAPLPSAVLFCCTLNALRSPMAEGLMKRLHGTRLYVQSVGLHAGETDPMMIEVMAEIGIDLSRHQPRDFSVLGDDNFDVVVSLSSEVQEAAVELTRTNDCAVEYWPVPDPSLADASRDARLESYRAVRDELWRRILRRFPPPDAAETQTPT